MIGIVIVSHSHLLAEGVREIAEQMAGDQVRIASAGGLRHETQWHLGTDPVRIHAAVEEAWSSDGVLVLLDTGSAIMSTEMAIEMLPVERRDAVLISNAPLVEGAIVAALNAGLGYSLEQVNEAAEEAMTISKVNPP